MIQQELKKLLEIKNYILSIYLTNYKNEEIKH